MWPCFNFTEDTLRMTSENNSAVGKKCLVAALFCDVLTKVDIEINRENVYRPASSFDQQVLSTS